MNEEYIVKHLLFLISFLKVLEHKRSIPYFFFGFLVFSCDALAKSRVSTIYTVIVDTVLLSDLYRGKEDEANNRISF